MKIRIMLLLESCAAPPIDRRVGRLLKSGEAAKTVIVAPTPMNQTMAVTPMTSLPQRRRHAGLACDDGLVKAADNPRSPLAANNIISPPRRGEMAHESSAFYRPPARRLGELCPLKYISPAREIKIERSACSTRRHDLFERILEPGGRLDIIPAFIQPHLSYGYFYIISETTIA